MLRIGRTVGARRTESMSGDDDAWPPGRAVGHTFRVPRVAVGRADPERASSLPAVPFLAALLLPRDTIALIRAISSCLRGLCGQGSELPGY